MKKSGFTFVALFILTISYMLIGCAPDAIVKKYVLKKGILDDARKLKIDTIGIELINSSIARDYFVYADSVLIVVNNKTSQKEFIDFFNLKTSEKIISFFQYGNGHLELLSANVDLNKNTLIVNDFMKAQFSILNIDSVLKMKEYYNLTISKHTMYGSPTVVSFNDNFIVENPYCYFDEENNILQGIEQGVPRFLSAMSSEGKNGDKYEHNPRNVAVDGRIIAKDNGKSLVYAHFGKSIVEFYNKELSLVKMVEGPKVMDIEYDRYKLKDNPQDQIIYKNKIPYSYLGYCCDDDYVYLMYIGDFYVNEKSIGTMNTYILKFDWDGNYYSCYECGRYLTSISKGNDPDVFYGTAINRDGEPFLIKMHL